MGTGEQPPPLKVDPEQLAKLGHQLLAAASDLPDPPPPFAVTGADAISAAIAERLPSIEGPIRDALPRLKDEAMTTAANVIAAAQRYSITDEQLAADYAARRFEPTRGPDGG
jgi:hypothetical protein